MTPLQIQMMLHYYAIEAPYSKHNAEHACSHAVLEQRQNLMDLDLLVRDGNRPSGYRVTERGVVYIKALRDMPLPEKVIRWTIPKSA